MGIETLFETKSFYIKDPVTMRIAVADLTLIPYTMLLSYGLPLTSKGLWYYFNRLNVPLEMRRQGYSRQLLTKVCTWSDEHSVSIYIEISPYGDMKLEPLVKLYSDYGFKLIKGSVMIRRVEGNSYYSIDQ